MTVLLASRKADPLAFRASVDALAGQAPHAEAA